MGYPYRRLEGHPAGGRPGPSVSCSNQTIMDRHKTKKANGVNGAPDCVRGSAPGRDGKDHQGPSRSSFSENLGWQRNGVNGAPHCFRGSAPGRDGEAHQGPSRSSFCEILGWQTMRCATLNLGTMSGKGREVAAMLSKRKVDVCCVQETRWKGNSARLIGEGFKLFYAGETSGRNGVGVIPSERMWGGLVEVKRASSRLMMVELVYEGEKLNVISAYAPQVGSGKDEKEKFWEEFDELLSGACRGVKVLVGGDLNGHVGKSREGYENVHGGWGFGTRNKEGEAILEAAVAHDLVVCNTLFQKKEQHLVTYESGQHKSQIDFLLIKKGDRGKCRDCKVIPSEWEDGQHKLVVMDFRWVQSKNRKCKTGVTRVKWGKLKEKEHELKRKLEAEIEWKKDGPVHENWDCVATQVRECCKQVLGVVKGGRQFVDKETWWWGEEVQKAVNGKKKAFKEWKSNKTQENRDAYNQAKKLAKKAVAIAKARKYDDLYQRLGSKEGENEVYRVAKQREQQRRDVGRTRCIKDESGTVLAEDDSIRKRWESYFCKLMNEGADDDKEEERGEGGKSEIADITISEVEAAMKKMRNGKAVGPDCIPVEIWKMMGRPACEWLQCLFNRMLHGEKMPVEWRLSWLVPVYKGKGDVQECKNYRGIKLLSHTMKLWERVIESRLRGETTIAGNQFGFMPGHSTAEPIFMVRQMMEKYRRKKKKMHVVFVDL